MYETLLIIAVSSAAAALCRAQVDRALPLAPGLIFAAYPPMGYTTIRK
jgi:hypothetical protein